jgi:hypothetical protein
MQTGRRGWLTGIRLIAGTLARQGGQRPARSRLRSGGRAGERAWAGSFGGAVGMQLGGEDSWQESDRARIAGTPARQGQDASFVEQ